MPSNGPVRTVGDTDRPRLAPHVRLAYDPARGRHVLLGTGAAILDLCDGERTVTQIVAELSGRYAHVAGDEVRLFLARLAARRCVEVGDG